MEEKELIELLRDAPSSGISEAIAQYGGLVQVIVRRILAGAQREEIEDCVSDVFAKLWESRNAIDQSRGSLKSYLAAIARNMAINRYRSRERAPELLPLEETLLSSEENPEETVSSREDCAQLRELLLMLPQPDQEIFIRRYYFFESIKEIAHRLRLNNKQVENKLFRGRQKLKKQLMERGVVYEKNG